MAAALAGYLRVVRSSGTPVEFEPSASLEKWAKVWLACGLLPLFPASVMGWDYFTHILLYYDWSWSMAALLALGGVSYGLLLAGPAAIVVASLRLLFRPSLKLVQVVIMGGGLTALWGIAFLVLSIAEGQVSSFLVIVELTSLVVVGTAFRGTRIMGRGIA